MRDAAGSGWLELGRSVGRSASVAGWLLASSGQLLASLRTPRKRDGDMARTAQQPIVFEAALAPTVSNRDNVIGFPARARRAPRPTRHAIGDRRLRSRPLSMSLHDVERANLTNALIALFDLLTNVPGTAPDLPLVNTRVTAERAPWWRDHTVTPSADRFARRVALGLPPLIRRHNTRATSAHLRTYRREGIWPLASREQRAAKTVTHPP